MPNNYRKLFDVNKKYTIDTSSIVRWGDEIFGFVAMKSLLEGIGEIAVKPLLEKVRGRYQWMFVAADADLPAGMVFHVYRPHPKEAEPMVYMVWFHNVEQELMAGSCIGNASIIKEVEAIDNTFNEMMSWMK